MRVPDEKSGDSIVDAADILGYRRTISKIFVEESVARYMLAIISETRDPGRVRLGASTRAAIALLRGSQAISALQRVINSLK